MAFQVFSAPRPVGPELSGLPTPMKEKALTFGKVVDKAAVSFLVLVLGTCLGWLVIPVAFWWVAIPAAVVAVTLGIMAHEIARVRGAAASVLGFALMEGVALGGLAHAVDGIDPGFLYQMIAPALCVMGVVLFFSKVGVVKEKLPRPMLGFLPVVGYAVFLLISVALKLAGVVKDPWGMHGVMWHGISIALFTGILIVIMASIFVTLTVAELNDAVVQQVSEKEVWAGVFLFSFSLVWMYWEIIKMVALIAYSLTIND